MNEVFLYLASGLTTIWGVSHLFPTKNVVKGFGAISVDNQRIITMEWIVEGATLIFLGLLIAMVTFIDPNTFMASIVLVCVMAMLLALAVISFFTGFKVDFLPFKICPFIFTTSAVMILLGLLL